MGRKIFFLFSFLLLSVASLYCLILVCGFALAPEVYAKTESPILTITESSLSSEISKTTWESSALSSPQSKAENNSEIPAATNNTAKGEGGAIYCNCTDCPITNCNFYNNTGKNGGAIYVEGDAIIDKLN